MELLKLFVASSLMPNSILPLEFYRQTDSRLEAHLKELKRRSAHIGWLRLLIAIATLSAIYLTWETSVWLIAIIAITGLGLFLFVVSTDTDNRNGIVNTQAILQIIRKEIAHLDDRYQNAYDGKNLQPAQHPYADDIDLFGPSSLFQYINRGSSEQGRRLLALRLSQPLGKNEILTHQQAVQELSLEPDWRQQFLAFGQQEKITENTERRVLQWLKANDDQFDLKTWNRVLYVYPVITIGSLLLNIMDVMPLVYFLPLFVIFYLFSLSVSKKISPVYSLLSQIVAQISVLYRQLEWFEQRDFKSGYLQQLKRLLQGNTTRSASFEIKSLQNILNRFDLRLNAFAFFFLNTFFLWDLWQWRALKKWKEENGDAVPSWFDALARIEVSVTFATLSFNHPDWRFPVIADSHFTFEGSDIGHPLIPTQRRVTNSFAIEGTGKVVLITGSNMAGKSTFLRSVAVNFILALAGAPVCARELTVSVAKLMTSMRISDNLAESTSTFYAELLKLKTIIESVDRKEMTFILLDEILRGTNSLDRHTGAKALVRQLIRHDAVGVIATHDQELARMDTEFPRSISNYHFDVQVSGDELYFDYRLKPGICQSLNASILMKKIGIEM